LLLNIGQSRRSRAAIVSISVRASPIDAPGASRPTTWMKYWSRFSRNFASKRAGT